MRALTMNTRQEAELSTPRVGERDAAYPELLRLAWPAVIAMLSFTVMDVADTLFVGQLGKDELGALGLSTTIVFVLQSFAFGLLAATRVVTSQFDGAAQQRRFGGAATASLLLSVGIGVCFIPLALFSDTIFAATGASENVQRIAREYFNIRVFGVWAWLAMIGLGNFLKGTGDTRTPMMIAVVANTLNVVLDPILIFGLGPFPELTHRGAAHATNIASLTGGLLSFVIVHLRVAGGWRYSPRALRSTLSLGLPMGLQWFFEMASWSVFISVVARIGDSELAAHTIVIKIIMVSFLPGLGIGESASVLAGRLVGGLRDDLILPLWRRAAGLGLVLMGFCGALFFVFPRALIGAFGAEGDVLAIGQQLLFVAAVFQLADALAMISSQTLDGTGDSRFTMTVSVSTAWLLFVPLTILFAFVLDFGAVGAWWAICARLFTMAAVYSWRLHSGRWRRSGLRVSEASSALAG